MKEIKSGKQFKEILQEEFNKILEENKPLEEKLGTDLRAKWAGRKAARADARARKTKISGQAQADFRISALLKDVSAKIDKLTKAIDADLKKIDGALQASGQAQSPITHQIKALSKELRDVKIKSRQLMGAQAQTALPSKKSAEPSQSHPQELSRREDGSVDPHQMNIDLVKSLKSKEKKKKKTEPEEDTMSRFFSQMSENMSLEEALDMITGLINEIELGGSFARTDSQPGLPDRNGKRPTGTFTSQGRGKKTLKET